MLYETYDWNRRVMDAWGDWAHATATSLAQLPEFWSSSPVLREVVAEMETASRLAHAYKKPSFGITEVQSTTGLCGIREDVSVVSAFCHLIHFRKTLQSSKDRLPASPTQAGPTVLVVAPLSGHYATLLRDTVRSLLRDHDVWITDWQNARTVPLAAGPFSLDDYVEDVERCLRHIGPAHAHVLAVCQPVVPVLGAVSLMAARGEPTPRSVTLMGGPVDTRQAPTKVNDLATDHSWEWFRDNLIHTVPLGHAGAGRRVYPGFLQHVGFVAMNPQRHGQSYWDFYQALVRGDHETADAHRAFYDEYNAVLDLPAEYYLDTIRVVFQDHLLPRGLWDVRGARVRPETWAQGALLTLEGVLDDISGLGQTRAAQDLCSSLSSRNKIHQEIPGVGHYGLFSGHRWREEIYPVIRDFIAKHDAGH